MVVARKRPDDREALVPQVLGAARGRVGVPIRMLAAGIELVSMGRRFLDTLSSGVAVQMPLRPPLLMLLAPVETTW